MRLCGFLCALCVIAQVAAAQDLNGGAWQLESTGHGRQAFEQLQKAAQASPNDPAALRAYAEFLDEHRNPAARAAYSRLAQVLAQTNAPGAQRAEVARREVILDLIAGDRTAATRDLASYHAAGGTGLALPAAVAAPARSYIEIPGPLRSFARMAALAPDLDPEGLLPALARNVVTNGYQSGGSNEALEQTEYLKLVVRYLSQARELERLAGDSKMIRVPSCDSSQTGDLLRVLGYRMRGGCGSDVVLETVNAARAFLTIDSGFPLAELEQALRTNHPFTFDYHPARVPLLYDQKYWQAAKDKSPFIDYFISDPSLCRLYVALSKLDPETANALRAAMPASRLKVYAHVLDFFGSMFQIRDGRAVVPGGARSEKAWGDLAGTSPAKGTAFFQRLIVKDDGWLASYYDSLARINGPVKDYLTEPDHLKRFYSAMRGRVTSPGPARPVFRANTDLLLLVTRLRLDPNGTPHIPGGVDVWKNLFVNHPRGKYDSRLTRDAKNWKNPDDVIEALFALCRKMVENEPLHIFMALSDLDRNRRTPLAPPTVDRLARQYSTMGAQYSLFTESPSLSDKTILQFLDTARAIDEIHNVPLRADAAGSMQALVGIWQICTRQRSIPEDGSDAALAGVLAPFSKIQNDRDLFDAARSALDRLFQAAHSAAKTSPQNRMLDLLAGTGNGENSTAHREMVQEMKQIFDAQKLVSLDTLFALADDFESVAEGKKFNAALAGKLASRISEITLPRESLGNIERSSMAFGYWTDRHIDGQRKLNLRASIDKADNDPRKIEDLRGALAPFLRDTLVGFNYMHYAPPGAQVLETNPLFVRSHDFIGSQASVRTWRATQVFGTGWPANAGGRLVGSLIALPYALAEAEQNFLVPAKEQALIWGDLVPQMILSAVVPRWWNVTPLQLHWVGVHMAYAETLLGESALDPARRKQVIGVLDHYAPPVRISKVEDLLSSGEVSEAEENVVPSEMYLLAEDMRRQDRVSPLAAELNKLAAEAPAGVSTRAISHAFGTPKPTLANSYEPELLNLRTFPTLMGYSSRILAETWESNLLFYAALADETYVPPAQLNVLVPEWTESTVEQIFATHLEDWPALLRSLRAVGDEVREKAHQQVLTASN